MRTALIGTVTSTLVALRTLIGHGTPPLALVTLAPDLADRHSDYVDLSSEARGVDIECLPVRSGNEPETVARLNQLNLDYLFVIGWSRLCSPALLATAREGAIGYHPSPLPRLRGRAVIPWTILLEEEESGSTLFWIDQGLDSGPIAAQSRFSLSDRETASSLYAKHMTSLQALLIALVPALRDGTAPRYPQNEAQASYCAQRKPDDGLIDWRQSAEEIDRLIRAVGSPYPGAFTRRASHKLTIWQAKPAAGAHRYFGIPGQVQDFGEVGPLVMCGDGNCLELISVEDVNSGKAIDLRRHERLGS